MTAAVYNITIDKEADFSRSFVIKEDAVVKDLTDHSFAAQVRTHHTDTSATSFTITITDAANGVINLAIADTVTADMEAGTSYWDLVMIDDNGLKSRLLEGKAFVKAGVTR
jgi:hypothetical protein